MIKVLEELFNYLAKIFNFVQNSNQTKKVMKMSTWLSQKKKNLTSISLVTVMALVWTGCAVDSVNPAAPGKAVGKKVDSQINENDNSQSSLGDYNITVTKDGTIWTYCISKNPGAKGLSHFILNLQNCRERSVTIDNILWATVNGQPATLESSEGQGAGCDVTTSNFVKFDNLPDASSYKIVFELNKEFGNFVNTVSWLKAGTSCNTYVVNAPCCPFN